MRVVGSISCWAIHRSSSAPTVAFVRATFSASASARSLVRSFSASFVAARSDRPLPGTSIGTLSTSTMRSPVLGSSPADTRTWTRSRIRRMLPRERGVGGPS